jgi:dTDP-4-dehydrorhamnose 3,5-epimerase
MSIKVESLAIPDVKLVLPARIQDDRGFFSETYNQARFREHGFDAEFIQDNHSHSVRAFTIRGLHFQAPPFAQAKLVRVVRGAIVDVAVDVRKGSATYGRWVKAVLSAENGLQIFVPRGFLHGFATLVADTEVVYKVDAAYSKECDGNISWNDPDLGIDWGIDNRQATLSPKDAAAPAFCDFVSPF